MALTTNLVVASVPPNKAGAASGLATTCSDLGISLGIAIIGSIGAAIYRTHAADTLPTSLPPDTATASPRASTARSPQPKRYPPPSSPR